MTIDNLSILQWKIRKVKRAILLRLERLRQDNSEVVFNVKNESELASKESGEGKTSQAEGTVLGLSWGRDSRT